MWLFTFGHRERDEGSCSAMQITEATGKITTYLQRLTNKMDNVLGVAPEERHFSQSADGSGKKLLLSNLASELNEAGKLMLITCAVTFATAKAYLRTPDHHLYVACKNSSACSRTSFHRRWEDRQVGFWKQDLAWLRATKRSKATLCLWILWPRLRQKKELIAALCHRDLFLYRYSIRKYYKSMRMCNQMPHCAKMPAYPFFTTAWQVTGSLLQHECGHASSAGCVSSEICGKDVSDFSSWCRTSFVLGELEKSRRLETDMIFWSFQFWPPRSRKRRRRTRKAWCKWRAKRFKNWQINH